MPLPPIEAGLTLDELQRSEKAGDRYSKVTAEEVFSATGSSLKAAELRRNDPVRYRKLKREYAITLGEIKGDLIPE
jgi:hypothetical protein